MPVARVGNPVNGDLRASRESTEVHEMQPFSEGDRGCLPGVAEAPPRGRCLRRYLVDWSSMG